LAASRAAVRAVSVDVDAVDLADGVHRTGLDRGVPARPVGRVDPVDELARLRRRRHFADALHERSPDLGPIDVGEVLADELARVDAAEVADCPPIEEQHAAVEVVQRHADAAVVEDRAVALLALA
jgi:hypothetical protein